MIFKVTRWMGVDGRGWAWMGMDGHGWAWMGVDGRFSMCLIRALAQI